LRHASFPREKATPVHAKIGKNTNNTSLIVQKRRAIRAPLSLSENKVISFYSLPLFSLEGFFLKLVLFVTKLLSLVKINFACVPCL
jgi:hypothetical protein